MFDGIRRRLGHIVLPKKPLNVVNAKNYIALMCKRDRVKYPYIILGETPQGALGAFWPPNNICFFTDPTYEELVKHEYLHYLGFVHTNNPCFYVAEHYEYRGDSSMWPFKKNNEKFHPFCAYCMGSKQKPVFMKLPKTKKKDASRS